MTFKVGDKVKVKKDLIVDEKYGVITFCETMRRDDVCEIVWADPDDDTYLFEHYGYWYSGEMLELADVEEAGKTVKLPCKVGDTIFYINRYSEPPKIEEFIVTRIVCNVGSMRIDYELHFILNGRDEFLFYPTGRDDIFFTREDAEKKLAELKGEN